MRYLRAELLQWYGLFGAAIVWGAQLVVGFGAVIADCNVDSQRMNHVVWQVVLLVIALVFAISAEIAAVRVVLSTRELEYDGPPPGGRQHFFAWGAMLGNVVFLALIVLTGVGAISHGGCRQA